MAKLKPRSRPLFISKRAALGLFLECRAESDRDWADSAHGCVYVWDEREAAIHHWTDSI